MPTALINDFLTMNILVDSHTEIGGYVAPIRYAYALVCVGGRSYLFRGIHILIRFFSLWLHFLISIFS